jgi:intron-binding protein aquarius
LLGDHHQLPPVVKNSALKKYSRFDQSLFSRLVRLGVHTIKLDLQGRARPELSALYSWRYNTAESSLLNLPVVSQDDRFLKANAGFRRTFQFINIENFQGRGEYSPSPYSFQNSGEAEYVVAVFMYMRLLGYPADRITILTSYNGQKNLIRDILEQRCQLPMFGKPSKVTTVDKYQGSQNDFILLSLVRTENVGHMRDIRRLVVAMSRAKLGLYVFGCRRLFENCLDLAPVFQKFADNGNKLELVPSESSWANTKRLSADSLKADQIHTVEDVTAMGLLVFQLTQQIQSSAL